MKARVLLLTLGVVICLVAWPRRTTPALPATTPSTIATTAAEERVELAPAKPLPPPEQIDLGDSYPVAGRSRTFLRRAGEVAVRLHAGDSLEKLVAPGGAFAGCSLLRSFPQGVSLLRAPAEEISRQVADPARAAVWLGELQDSRAAAMANPVLVDPGSGLFLVPFGEILVRLKEGIDPAAHFGSDFARATLLPGTTDQWLVVLEARDFETTMAAIQRHAASPAVTWAEVNFIGESKPCFIPNDPLYPDQWHLGGDTSGAIGYNRADIRAEAAWDTTRGDEDIVVAVIDDAIDMVHEDLVANLFTNTNETAGNGLDDDNNGFIDDRNGWNFFLNNNNPAPTGAGSAFGTSISHGTAVAGVAVARGHNGVGVSGAAPRCRLLPANLANTSAGEASQLRYVAGLTGNGWRGADVVNLSYTAARDAAKDAAFADAARRGRQGRGCVLIAAAGNSAGAWFEVRLSLAAGVHNFEWRYLKDASTNAGQDAVWVDDIGFYDPNGTFTVAEYGFTGFGGSIAGFTTGGSAGWTIYSGSDRATGILDSSSARSGAIGANQTSSLFYSKALAAPAEMRFKVWVDSQRDADRFRFFKDGVQLQEISGQTVVGQTAFDSHSTSGVGPQVFASGAAYRVDPAYPANHPDVICVGASTDYDRRSDYSQYGAKVDVVAPSSGGDLGIVTTDLTGAPGNNNQGNYASFRTEDGFGGTSSASPLIAGVAALALSADPWMTRKQVATLLRDTADQVGGVTYDGNGRNLYYGHGRVNAASAVAAAVAPPATSYSQNFNAIEDNGVEFGDGSSFYSNVQVQATANVAGWQSWTNFINLRADAGNELNANIVALSAENVTGSIAFSDAGDGSGARAFVTGWEGGANSKSWLLPVNTKNFQSLSFTCRLMGTNNFFSFLGPRDFKLQYRVPGFDWADVAGGAIQAGNGTFTTLNVALPQECDDQPGLQLRLLMTSNTAVQGGTVSGGQSHLDDVLVTGSAIHSTASVQDGALRMTKDGVNNMLSHYVLPELGSPVTQGFEASFRYKMSSAGDPADGFSFNFGDLDEGTNLGEQGFGEGLCVRFVTYLSVSPRHEVRLDGAAVPGGFSSVPPSVDNAWHRVKVRWRKSAGTGINGPGQGHLTLVVDDVAIFRDVPLSFDPESHFRMSFAARTGDLDEDLWLDDVQVQPLGPDYYTRNYDGLPTDTTELGDGTTTTSTQNNGVGVGVAGGRVGFRLNEAGVSGNTTAHILPDLGAGPRQGFEATFKYYMAPNTPFPADGFAFNLGNPASANGGEEGLSDGLAVGFNIYSYLGHKVLVDGTAGTLNPQDPFVDAQWHDVVIRWERTAASSGELTLKVDGQTIFDRAPTTGYTPAATDRFAFTSRTGFYTADILIDDVSVRPLYSLPLDLGPLVIRRQPFASETVALFSLKWGSVAGRAHRAESCGDLQSWEPIFTRAGVDGFDFTTVILSLEDDPRQFFRVVREE